MTKKNKNEKLTPSQQYKREPKGFADKSKESQKLITFSFRYLDRNQGQRFEEWEKQNILSLLFQRLANISMLTVSQITAEQIIKPYTKVDFPPQTKFTYPKHVPIGVTWAVMHIQGKECVIGFLEENIFYIVFLDENHSFWETDLQNRGKNKR